MEKELLKPVTYGSIIYLSTESNLDSYMFCDGFVDKNVKLKSFKQISGTEDYYDFSFCLFMVIPFSGIQSFEQQNNVILEWRDILLNSKEEKLQQRKEDIAKMANRLESEFQFNLGLVQKSQGTSICFGSSNFMLLHLNSMKYLSLFQDDNNNLFLQLREDPDQSCFFNFDPSLKLQKGRSDNFVYEEEIVYISCARKFSGKSPYLSILQDETIIGLIDSKENWKVNIYEKEEETSEATSMKVGQCVWIVSSEKPLFLNGQRDRDPFYELYEYQFGLRKIQDSPFIEKIKKEDLNLIEEFVKNPRLHLFDCLRVQLSNISEGNDQSVELKNPFGMWKIEGMNIKEGGELRWDQCYKLKHLISGKYLTIIGGSMQLIDKCNEEDLEFRFLPIDNLIQYKSKSSSKISKDAFFWIQHKTTGFQIGFDQDQLKLFKYRMDVNTFRFKEAVQENVWENYTINSIQKLLLRQVSYLQDLIIMSQSMKQDKKKDFDLGYDTTIELLDFLAVFLNNAQVSNLNMAEDVMSPCKNRQDRLREQYSLGLLCWMVVQMFPTMQEFEILQMNPDEESGVTVLKKRKGFKYQKNMSYNYKMAQLHLTQRYRICKMTYQILATASQDNPQNQKYVMQYIGQLSNHIGLGQFVSKCLIQIVGNNRELLEELHRHHINNEDHPKKTYDIFQAMAHRLKFFQPYYKIEILELLNSTLTQGNQAIYINQEKVFHAIVDNKNFLFGHLMKIFEDKQILYVEYSKFMEREYESNTLHFEKFMSAKTRSVTYFKEQLKLYSRLCQNRNYASVKNMQELLPQHVLLKYLQDPQLKNDIKAILCSFLLNLYVDQEPRSIINKPSFVRVANQSKDQITKQFIELNLRDDIQGTHRIFEFMLQYLKDKYELIQTMNFEIEDVYNELTYEIIRIVRFMVKFGLFTSHASEIFSKTLGIAATQQAMDCLIQYMSTLLEFDYNYFQELRRNGFQRSYQKQTEEAAPLIINFFKKKKAEEEEEDVYYKKQEKGSAKYLYLRRYDSLFKLIRNFSNKTCNNPFQSENIILIKKQICLIFSDLFEWREDFYIENAIIFFENDMKKDYHKLLPRCSVDPDHKFKKQKKYLAEEEMKDFDEILGRPFVEVLILAFYFAKDYELQNNIANLIFKRYSQRKKFIQNISKVSLVNKDNDSYSKLSRMLNDIKNLFSYSQSWLQIIESDQYDEKAEDTLCQTYQKLNDLYQFWIEQCDGESFLVKQKIFKHISGQKALLKFLETGMRVIQQKINYFHGNQSEYSYKRQFIHQVIQVFTITHKILSKYVEGNDENQIKLFNGYPFHFTELNIGQVEFLQSLFQSNIKLSVKDSSIVIKFIKQHGHYDQFLQLFLIQLDCAQAGTNQIQKNILNYLTSQYKYFNPFLKISDDNLKQKLPPFYKQNDSYIPPDEERFKQSLIQIICTCVQAELSMVEYVNLIHKLSVSDLMELMLIETDLQTLKNVYTILRVYFDKIDGSISQLQKSCNQFSQLLEKVAVIIQEKYISQENEELIGECIIGLVNIYFENFLKDIGMISLKMLAQDESIQKEKFIFQFSQTFVDHLHHFKHINKEMRTNIIQLGQNFSIEVHLPQGEHQINFKEKVHIAMNIQKALEKKKPHEKWAEFVGSVKKDQKVKAGRSKEKLKFPNVILQISDIFQIPQQVDLRLKELIISKDDILTTLLNYIQHWKMRKASKNTIIFIISSIQAILDMNQQEMTKRQIYLDSLGATHIILKLYWKDKQTEDQYIYSLIKLIIGLLNGGNKVIQESILDLMKNNAESERFFMKIYGVLQQQNNQGKVRWRQKIIEKTLQLIQLLCEGHNTKLQNYLRQQTNSKVSYDIVSLMVKLVITSKISNNTYDSNLQCLETLTEVVQGPCKENQVVIVTSKFIQWSIDLLREDEKLFEARNEQHELPIKRILLNRLKFKCSVTLLSLLEMQEQNEEIMNLMVRSIPQIVLVQELGSMYRSYKEFYQKEYLLSAFKRYEQKDLDKKKNECIIEYGFNLYILLNILMLHNKKNQEPELEEIRNLIKQYYYVTQKKKSLESLFELDDLFSIDFNFNILQGLQGDDDEESSELKKEAENRAIQKEAVQFFSQNTVFIEILREDNLYRIYFPLLPQCKMLPKESKQEFHEIVDHSSIRDKLVMLMNKADNLRKVMEHEEWLRNIFKRVKVIELIATHKALWENLSFISNILINFVIIVSFSSYAYIDGIPQDEINSDDLQYARLYDPRLFFVDDYTWTWTLIMILGYINLGFSMLVIGFFAIKKSPLLIADMWKEFIDTPMSWFYRIIMFIYYVILSFIKCLVDFDFAYYCGYMACIILGLIIHPFIFVFLMADFLRIATLKIVIKAIWISRIQMGLSFLVFLLVEYYFTIISYIYFYDQYSNNTCSKIWLCFLETFDQTFKNGGAIGDYLQNGKVAVPGEDEQFLPYNYDLTYDQQISYLMRFFFDVLFKFILVVLIINMVAGIIIDTFGALKDDMLEKKSFLEDYCFICGIESEKLDKATQYGKYSHIKKDHYMWNYVFYKVYLFCKPKSELSGNETYVKRLMIKNDIDWFPIKQAMNFQDEEEEDDEEEQSNLALVESTLETVNLFLYLQLGCIIRIICSLNQPESQKLLI